MSAFTHSVLTDVGWDQLASALAGKNLTFLNMEAGDGEVTGDPEMETLTSLKNYVMDIPITSYSDDGKGQLTLIGTLTSKKVDAPFYFRELGVKASVGATSLMTMVVKANVLEGAGDLPPNTVEGRAAPTGEQLFCVSNCGENADYIPDKLNEAVVVQNVEIVVKIDKATDVTVNVAADANVTAQNIGPASVGAGHFRDKLGSVLYFKRFISTPNVRITETLDTVQADVIFPPSVPTGCMMDYPDVVPPTGWLNCDGSARSRSNYPSLFSLLGTRFGAGDGFSTFNLPDFRGRVAVGMGAGPGLSNRTLAEMGGIETATISLAQMPYHNHGATESAHSHSAWQDVHNHYAWQDAHAHAIYDGGHAHSISDPQHQHHFVYGNTDYANGPGVSNDGQDPYPWYNNVWGYVQPSPTNIGIYGAGTGIGIYAAQPGTYVDNRQPAVYIGATAATVSIAFAGGGQGHANMQPFLVINKIIKT